MIRPTPVHRPVWDAVYRDVQGPVWLNGAGGGVETPIYFFDGEQAMGRRMVVVGDSIASLHAVAGTPTAITLDGSTTMTVTQASHVLHAGRTYTGFAQHARN